VEDTTRRYRPDDCGPFAYASSNIAKWL